MNLKNTYLGVLIFISASLSAQSVKTFHPCKDGAGNVIEGAVHVQTSAAVSPWKCATCIEGYYHNVETGSNLGIPCAGAIIITTAGAPGTDVYNNDYSTGDNLLIIGTDTICLSKPETLSAGTPGVDVYGNSYDTGTDLLVVGGDTICLSKPEPIIATGSGTDVYNNEFNSGDHLLIIGSDTICLPQKFAPQDDYHNGGSDQPLTGSSTDNDDCGTGNAVWDPAPPVTPFGILTGTPDSWSFDPQGICGDFLIPYSGDCGNASTVISIIGCTNFNDNTEDCEAVTPSGPMCSMDIGSNDLCVGTNQVWVPLDCNGNPITTFQHPLYECTSGGCADGCNELADAFITGITGGTIDVEYNGAAYVNGEISGCITIEVQCVDADGNVIESDDTCNEIIFSVPPPEIELGKNITGTFAEGETVTINLYPENTGPHDLTGLTFSTVTFTGSGTPTNLTFVSNSAGSAAFDLAVGETGHYTYDYVITAADVAQESIVCSMDVTGTDPYGQTATDVSDDDGNGDSTSEDTDGDGTPDDGGDDDGSFLEQGCVPGVFPKQTDYYPYGATGALNRNIFDTETCISGVTFDYTTANTTDWTPSTTNAQNTLTFSAGVDVCAINRDLNSAEYYFYDTPITYGTSGCMEWTITEDNYDMTFQAGLIESAAYDKQTYGTGECQGRVEGNTLINSYRFGSTGASPAASNTWTGYPSGAAFVTIKFKICIASATNEFVYYKDDVEQERVPLASETITCP